MNGGQYFDCSWTPPVDWLQGTHHLVWSMPRRNLRLINNQLFSWAQSLQPVGLPSCSGGYRIPRFHVNSFTAWQKIPAYDLATGRVLCHWSVICCKETLTFLSSALQP